MNNFVMVDYNGGWNPNTHDTMLRNNIDAIFMTYDSNRSGSLEGQEFYNGYRDLCLRMGMCPPQDYMTLWNTIAQVDTNRDGRISKMEMFTMFKRLQGINSGVMY